MFIADDDTANLAWEYHVTLMKRGLHQAGLVWL